MMFDFLILSSSYKAHIETHDNTGQQTFEVVGNLHRVDMVVAFVNKL